MSIRSKVFGLIALVAVIYLVMDYAVQHAVITPHFKALENEAAQRGLDRVSETIERELTLLGTKATDWASWDDTYIFAFDQNAAFRATNLNATSLESLQINLLYLFDKRGRQIWGLTYDLKQQRPVTLAGLADQLSRSRLTKPDQPAQGLLMTELGPLLLASRPILTSSSEGPTRGSLIMGQLLDTASLASQTRSRLVITGLASSPPPEPVTQALRAAAPGRGALISASDTVQAYRQLEDIFNQPALLLRVDLPRTVSQRGRTAINFAMLSLLVGGALILATLLWGLRIIVLSPLARLSRHVVAISQGGDLNERIAVDRQDEIGQLSREFNRMLDRLREARESLAEQSYSAGVAAMAKGVLHNIGNAITPLSVKVSRLHSELRQAPTTELRLALKELGDPATPAERRAALTQFIELAGAELADLLEQSAQSLEQIRNQVDHVQLILADQQRFSRSQRVSQSLELAHVVNESIDLLSESLRRHVRIEPDESLDQLGKVKAARIALQQVLTNLLINAAESIETGSRQAGRGQIRIHGASEVVEGVPMAHLRIEDNGAGIAPEKLSRIFERGFSTKNRGSGLGLHWSANTVSAMNGRIYAESDGPGQGAIFHLLLPLAQDAAEFAERDQ